MDWKRDTQEHFPFVSVRVSTTSLQATLKPMRICVLLQCHAAARSAFAFQLCARLCTVSDQIIICY